MKIWLILIPVIFMTNCTNKDRCLLEDKITDGLSAAIASGLQCKKPGNIKADLVKISRSLGICEKPQDTGLLAELCVAVSGALIDGIVTAAIPASWECSAANAKALLKGAIEQACRTIPL